MARTPLSKIHTRTRTTPSAPTSASSTPGGGPKNREEKILVTVRVRPLNRKEQALYDLIAWDCLDHHTIVFKNPNHERPLNPYSFDKVFDPTCSTQWVYQQGAQDVALSALTGINATIFAYGQTSSGKTYTMRGITDNAVRDIFQHIKNNPERDFILKFSALEIYNETVVDLLNCKSGPLRLLDDPEKGTIVEKLLEEVVKDSEHLRHLVGICEAQRQVGETALNDKSSRSHQIIRLTIESRLREVTNCVKSLIASLNLVDLAGSERVSQTSADGTRLKEGSHINRSLLTLTTVIRKLSGGKKCGHIPYRDSKLTRILQSSLGGNARTAIICTMSPALSHVEQTRNTLSFATSAKEVTNNAQVNMVVSDNRLLKHLQSEVSRLEAELKSPESSSSCFQSLLLEKDKKIQQMEREIKELRYQLERERKAHEEQTGLDECWPSHVVRCLSFRADDDQAPTVLTPGAKLRRHVERQAILRRSVTSIDPSTIVHEIRKLEHCQRQLGEEANRALEVLHREVASHKLGSQEASETIAKMLSEIKDMNAVSSIPQETLAGNKANLMEEILRFKSEGGAIESLEKKLENVQKSIDKLVSSFPNENDEDMLELKNQCKRKKVLHFSLSNSTNMPQIIRSPCTPMSSSRNVMKCETENRDPEKLMLDVNTCPGTRKFTPKSEENRKNVSRDGTPLSQQSNSVNVKKMQRMFKTAAEENIRSIKAYVTELKERLAKLQYQKQLLVCQVLNLENENETDAMDAVEHSPISWNIVFEDQRKQIIMLWHLCHVSLIHRTQFYLLFKGDPSDQIYIEVEWRRLTWLEQHLAELGNASPALLGDEPASSVSASIKALKQEREYLAKRVSSKLTADEREMLYVKWEIPQVGKQRRLQLVNKLWTDPHNMKHIHDSAEIVAKLVGFCESEGHVSKEMFELNFVCPNDRKSWIGWNLISNLLNL